MFNSIKVLSIILVCSTSFGQEYWQPPMTPVPQQQQWRPSQQATPVYQPQSQFLTPQMPHAWTPNVSAQVQVQSPPVYSPPQVNYHYYYIAPQQQQYQQPQIHQYQCLPRCVPQYQYQQPCWSNFFSNF